MFFSNYTCNKTLAQVRLDFLSFSLLVIFLYLSLLSTCIKNPSIITRTIPASVTLQISFRYMKSLYFLQLQATVIHYYYSNRSVCAYLSNMQTTPNRFHSIRALLYFYMQKIQRLVKQLFLNTLTTIMHHIQLPERGRIFPTKYHTSKTPH